MGACNQAGTCSRESRQICDLRKGHCGHTAANCCVWNQWKFWFEHTHGAIGSLYEWKRNISCSLGRWLEKPSGREPNRDETQELHCRVTIYDELGQVQTTRNGSLKVVNETLYPMKHGKVNLFSQKSKVLRSELLNCSYVPTHHKSRFQWSTLRTLQFDLGDSEDWRTGAINTPIPYGA